MKTTIFICFFCCLFSSNSFSQQKAIYIKIVSTNLKTPQDCDIVYEKCNNATQFVMRAPSTKFNEIPIGCDSTIYLSFGLHDDIFNKLPVKYPHVYNVKYYNGDSILVDFDKGTATVINKRH